MLDRDRPRLIFVDDNVRRAGGHYLELASLLVQGAKQLGYEPLYATHRSCAGDQPLLDGEVLPLFRQRRMVRWSLGVDGASVVPRDLDGSAAGRSRWSSMRQSLTDRCVRPDRAPKRMLSEWAEDFRELLDRAQPRRGEAFVMSTSDDFMMLAVAKVLQQQPPSAALRIHFVFHFAVFEPEQPDCDAVRERFGRQVNAALDALADHDVHLHATTEGLADQLNRCGLNQPIRAIPYPSRPVPRRSPHLGGPLKVMLGGLPRAEKGRGTIWNVLDRLSARLLASDHYRIAMQMPDRRWKRMIPKQLRDVYIADRETARRSSAELPQVFEIQSRVLETEAYHRWLDTADIGLFLYDARRYRVRCSGILLELLCRGIPVIVPESCWLSDQVELAARDGERVGATFRHPDEIPERLEQLRLEYETFATSAMRYAETIASRHHAANTLATMGFAPTRRVHAAASDRNDSMPNSVRVRPVERV